MELLQQPGSGSVVLSLLGGLLLFGLVLLAAWFCPRWLGGYYRARGAQGGSIRVLERTVIGSDRTLMVVRVGERVLVKVSPELSYHLTVRSLEKGEDDAGLAISKY